MLPDIVGDDEEVWRMIGLCHSAVGLSLYLISTMCMNCILIEFRPGMGISQKLFSFFLFVGVGGVFGSKLVCCFD